MTFFQSIPWHSGEEHMHHALRVPDQDNPTAPQLTYQAIRMFEMASLLAVGTLDAQSRPWTTVWGGEPDFTRALGQSIIGVRTPVASRHDPVVETLVGTKADGEVVREEGQGRMVSGLSIDLETRRRVKLYGRMVAGALGTRREEGEGEEKEGGHAQGELQLVVRIEQSLGNCPKYLNKKHVQPKPTEPKLVSESTLLPPEAVKLLSKTDLFFVSTSHGAYDGDCNYRGGPVGFVRLLTNTSSSTVLVWPEYSGNRLYQTLGNLSTTPLAGLCFPDFETGDALYVTGTTEILIGADAAAILPRSNLAVKLTVNAARFVASVLPFSGTPGDPSPYNPMVRYLASERLVAPTDSSMNTAKLLNQTILTPTISCFRFALSNPATYRAGQYVTLDLSSHLDIGYAHMRDDDPRSLNDDFVRTFTVSSPPGLAPDGPKPADRLADDEFEITIRRVGVVTDFLFKHGLDSRGGDLEVGVKGFGGSFEIAQAEGETVGFVAGGVGITPLMPYLQDSKLDLTRLNVLWSVREGDVGLVASVVQQCPALAERLRIFSTGMSGGSSDVIAKLEKAGVQVKRRRLLRGDLDSDVRKWYLCTSTPLRKLLLDWLGEEEKEAVYEDFNF